MNLAKASIETMNRQEIKDYLFCIQDYFRKCINKGMEVDDILDNKAKFIGLRFFTVYGEWGRPDMFIIKLLNSIYNGKLFVLNNSGNHYRDFTYIKDIVKICYQFIKYKNLKNHEIFNVCASKSVNILKLSKEIQLQTKKGLIKNIPANKADVYETFGSNSKIKKALKIKKFTNINIGLKKTINWYQRVYRNNFK